MQFTIFPFGTHILKKGQEAVLIAMPENKRKRNGIKPVPFLCFLDLNRAFRIQTVEPFRSSHGLDTHIVTRVSSLQRKRHQRGIVKSKITIFENAFFVQEKPCRGRTRQGVYIPRAKYILFGTL